MKKSGRRAADPQVTTHATKVERLIFDAYARKFGLDANNLLHILWQRELRFERLHQIDEIFRDPAASSQAGGLDSKVTAHLGNPDLKPRIKQRAKIAGLSVSRAGAILLREEMSARWLEKTLDLTDSI